MKRRLILATTTLLIAACGTSTYRPLNPPNDKEAIVYFIREYAEPTAFSVRVHFDGEQAALISNKSFAAFSVPSGKHRLKLDWPPTVGRPVVEGDLDLLGEQKRYFLIMGDVDMKVGGINAYREIVMHTKSSLAVAEIPEEEAAKMMKRLGAN